MKYRILKIVFAVWVALWAFFIARELFLKDNIRDYRELFGRTLEGKRAYLTGDRLYGFLIFCKSTLPARATYELIGVEEGSIERRRAVYYLYPLLEARDAEFTLAYGQACVEKSGYMKLAGLGESGCIMKRIEGR